MEKRPKKLLDQACTELAEVSVTRLASRTIRQRRRNKDIGLAFLSADRCSHSSISRVESYRCTLPPARSDATRARHAFTSSSSSTLPPSSSTCHLRYASSFCARKIARAILGG